jgi:hypothetical protein
MILMFCTNCGNNLPDNAKYCEKCGTSQISPDTSCTPTHRYETHKVASKPSNFLKYLIIGIVGIIALVIIISVVLSYVSLGAGFVKTQTAHTAKVVAVTAQQTDSNHITVTNLGGQDAGMMSQLTVTVSDSAGNSQTKSMIFFEQKTPSDGGISVTFTGAFSGQDHVIAVGTFDDGVKQVLLDTNV